MGNMRRRRSIGRATESQTPALTPQPIQYQLVATKPAGNVAPSVSFRVQLAHDAPPSSCPSPASGTDLALARVAGAWPSLPAHIKAAVLALVDFAGGGAK